VIAVFGAGYDARTMRVVPRCLLVLVLAATASAGDAPPASPAATLSRFGDGAGPTQGNDGVFHLLDAARTKSQSNAVAFDVASPGAHESIALRCKMRVLEGGDGGAFAFLSTTNYGAHGPAPFVADWTEPNLRGTFAVGIDVHDPKNEEQFSSWGNYMGLPEREVSLHWDDREIVKRVAPVEFRGDFADVAIDVVHVVGGADVTVKIGAAVVYDRYFVAGFVPYESRLAIGADTRADATTEFDVKDVSVECGLFAATVRRPKHVQLFNHVLTDNAKTAFETTVDLPPLEWAFGRVIMTVEIHDAGDAWDEWDRVGEVSVVLPDGTKRGIVPFITSYRTPCRWDVDVTPFRPWLAGKTKLEVAAGTGFYKNRGFMMSVSLDFHHGAPDLEPFRVVPLWVGTAHYQTAENHYRDFFTPQTVAIDAETTAARVFMTTTGHSQVGEFTPEKRTVVFRADATVEPPVEKRFENTLWKDDCWLNPNRPQFGTWKFSRAGWAPGDVVRPWWIDLTPNVAPGKTATFSYEPQPYDFTGEKEKPSDAEIAGASQIVRAYLVLYRKPAERMPAPSLRIVNLVADGNAAKAGLKEGDYVVSYDGRALDVVDDLRAAIDAAKAAGKTKSVVVAYRGAEKITVEVGPGKLGVGLADR
jgi:hypothetical protein